MSKKTIEYCMCDICQKEGAQSYRALAYRTFDATEGRYFYRKPQFETACIDLCDDCASRVTALHSVGVMCNKFEIRPLQKGACSWIPVEERLPEPNKKVLATIVHHKWVSDYDSEWIPEDEKKVHEEWVETSEVVCISGKGFLYHDSECDFTSSYAHIKPEPDMSRPVDEVVAWCPLPEPYQPEKQR